MKWERMDYMVNGYGEVKMKKTDLDWGKHHEIFGYHNRDARKEMINFMKKQNLHPKSFIEAGGSGRRALAMAQLGVKSYFIDLCERQIKDPNLTCIYGSITEPQEIEPCELVFCKGVLQHTDYPAKALINLSKWTAVGGTLLTSFYDAESPHFFWVEVMRRLKPDNLTYEEMYKLRRNVNIEHLFSNINLGTYDIVKHDVEKLGFEIINVRQRAVFLCRKARDVSLDVSELMYKPNIPIQLSRESAVGIICEIIDKKLTTKRSFFKRVAGRIRRILGK